MSIDNTHSQEGIIKMLPPRKRKAYRERYRYWTKQKGLEPKEAHERAILPISNIVNIDGSQFGEPMQPELPFETFEPASENSQQNPGSEQNGFARKSASAERMAGISAPVRRLADLGTFPAASLKVNEDMPFMVKHTLSVIPLALLTLAVSYLLISASVDVFGHSLIGVIKALVLEASIIFLCLSKAHSWYAKIGKRMTATAMICLSLFVLHSGAELTTTNNVNTAISNDSELSMLKARHARLLTDYDRLPATYVSKRAESQKQLADLEGRISVLLSQAKNSASVSALEKVGLSEMIFRACLLILNLFLCHELIARFRKPFGGEVAQ